MLQKTITRFPLSCIGTTISSKNFILSSEPGTFTKLCFSPGADLCNDCVFTYCTSGKDVSINFFNLSGIVAETRTMVVDFFLLSSPSSPPLFRFFTGLSNLSTSSPNPASNNVSASSKTTNLQLPRNKLFSSQCFTSLPGVPTTTSTGASKLSFCNANGLPPKINLDDTFA